MRALETIDATPGKRIYTSIIADYDIEKALCELIDNALDNAKNNNLDCVDVKLILGVGSQTISVEDNSGGVLELRDLISPGATGNDIQKEIIGMFGVGTKRASVALAKNVSIKTRIKRDKTKILKYDEDWVNSGSWEITPFEADVEYEEILENNTLIELSNLRKSFDKNYVNKIKEHFSKIYAYFIRDKKINISVNDEQIGTYFYDNWSYSPDYSPTKYLGFASMDLKKIKVSIYSGLSNKSSPSGDWGVYIYCNNRLISKDLKNEQVGFGTGLAGKVHPSISLVNVLVFIEGEAGLMPWNSSKSEINFSHPVFLQIQKSIREVVTNSAKISRALEGQWEDKLFKYKTGEIKEESIVFEKGIKRNLPPIPASNKTIEKKINELNKELFISKPWLKGIFGGIETFEILRKKSFNGKSRYLLILLDSLLEISFKDFLANHPTKYFSDRDLMNKTSTRINLKNEIKLNAVGKRRITSKEWKVIDHYNRLRNKLIHERISVEIPLEEINSFYEVVKSTLSKIFDLNFKIQ